MHVVVSTLDLVVQRLAAVEERRNLQLGPTETPVVEETAKPGVLDRVVGGLMMQVKNPIGPG